MAIKYVTNRLKNGHKQTRVELDREIGHDAFCRHISLHSTVNMDVAHIKYAIAQVVYYLTEFVAQNDSVKIEGLGKFQPRVKVKDGKPEVSVLFTPSCERDGILQRLKREKCVKLEEEWDPFPHGIPITSEETKRRQNLLNKIDED